MTDHNRVKEAIRITNVGILTNITLIVIKFLGGIFGRSSAVIADAVHSFADFASDLIVIAGLRLASKPADKTHKYGHGKWETLAALLLGLILFVTGLGICLAGTNSIVKFVNGETLARPEWVALLAAGLSVVFKEWLYHYTIRYGKKLNSQPVVANALNHRSDAFTSLGVLAGITGSMVLGPGWRVLDPIAAVFVGLFIFRIASQIIKQSADELLEASAGEEIENEILQITEKISGVEDVHNLKTRKIGSQLAIDMHIYVNELLNIKDAHDISTRVENELNHKFGSNTIVSVHVEPQG